MADTLIFALVAVLDIFFFLQLRARRTRRERERRRVSRGMRRVIELPL
jgi:hypothetical protein